MRATGRRRRASISRDHRTSGYEHPAVIEGFSGFLYGFGMDVTCRLLERGAKNGDAVVEEERPSVACASRSELDRVRPAQPESSRR